MTRTSSAAQQSDQPARLFAPAKVNLGLSVLGLRTDGYHDIQSVMVPLNIGDELEVSAAPTLTLELRGDFGPELSADEGNLVYRAARAYLDAAGVVGGARIVLHKHLPLASGLGGGSSDAATTLMSLSRLYPSGPQSSSVDLLTLAKGLGADVPFFLTGVPALVSGIGDRLMPLTLPALHLVLVYPGVAVSAADAYRWLDQEDEFSPPLDLDRLLSALGRPGGAAALNALQGPVVARHKEVAQALHALSAAGLSGAVMSGSGSSCFAVARTAAQAQDAAAALAGAHPDWWVRAAVAG